MMSSNAQSVLFHAETRKVQKSVLSIAILSSKTASWTLTTNDDQNLKEEKMENDNQLLEPMQLTTEKDLSFKQESDLSLVDQSKRKR